MTRLLLTLLLISFSTQSASGDESRSPDSAGAGRSHLILERFPTSAEWYRPEAAALIRSGIIQRYGEEEWAAVVLSHELHQHLGIYTILGAKMGVRARELLAAPPRAVKVSLTTGGNGPMTCAADGIQVSLASTFGQQLVEVQFPEKPVLVGVFEYGGRRLKLALDPESQQKMDGYIEAAETAHGHLTPEYFHALEDISFKVWAEFDRASVFSAEWLPAE